MKVFCTGISGSGRGEYIERFIKYSKDHGKNIKVLDVGKMIFDTSKKLGRKIKEEKILNLSISTLNWLRAVVFERILREIYENKNADYIVSSHTTFRWKKYLLPAFEFFYLNELSPDIYVTVVDSVMSIKQRLEQHPQWRKKLSIREILTWQDEEIFVTKMLASYQRKPHYVISFKQPSETLFKLMYSSNIKKVYLSFPITHVKQQQEHLISVKKFRDELRKHFVVFDPMTINDMELLWYIEGRNKDMPSYVTIEEIKEAQEDIKFHTVRRDYMFIDQSDMIVVYYPMAVMSPGVLSEMIYGYTNNKDVYVIFTRNESTSPFFEYYATKIFKSKENFLKEIKSFK